MRMYNAMLFAAHRQVTLVVCIVHDVHSVAHATRTNLGAGHRDTQRRISTLWRPTVFDSLSDAIASARCADMAAAKGEGKGKGKSKGPSTSGSCNNLN